MISWFLMGILWILWFSMKNTEIHEFTRISQICKEIAHLRRRLKTAVIQRYFNHSGAHFLAQTSQKQFFGISSVILLNFMKFLPFHWIYSILWEFKGFPLLRRPRRENTNNSLGISTILKGPEARILLEFSIFFRNKKIMWIYPFSYDSSEFLGNRGNPMPHALAADNLPRPWKT